MVVLAAALDKSPRELEAVAGRVNGIGGPCLVVGCSLGTPAVEAVMYFCQVLPVKGSKEAHKGLTQIGPKPE